MASEERKRQLREAQNRLNEKRKAEGLKPLQLWTKPEHFEEIREFAKKLAETPKPQISEE